jgi:alpha-N-acetylgalactosaminidase
MRALPLLPLLLLPPSLALPSAASSSSSSSSPPSLALPSAASSPSSSSPPPFALPRTAPLLKSPPMGWMAWDQFRCAVDCNATDLNCVNLRLFTDQARLLAEGGFLAAGYNRVHFDDCAVARERDNATGILPLDPIRFPGGLAALSAALSALNVELGIYTAISYTTCEGYPGSRGYEAIDAANWAAHNVTYVKADGCGDSSYFPVGYPILGDALEAAGVPLTYSCSWPAYDGAVETSKNWSAYTHAHCATGRTFSDMQCAWDSPPPLGGTPMLPILDHYGDYSAYLQTITTQTGFVMDGDQLVAGSTNPDTGAPCYTLDEERTQMALWSILAFPLIMGNDLRIMREESAAVVLNPYAIAINQDGVVGGLRVSPKGALEVWARNMSNGSVAVALFNKEGPVPPASCEAWNSTGPGWFYEAGNPCGSPNGNEDCFGPTTNLADALAQCCGDPLCAGISYDAAGGSGGCYKTDVTCPYNESGIMGFYKPNWTPAPPPPATAANITVDLALLGFSAGAAVTVFDVWAGAPVEGEFVGNYTATDVPAHGTAFLILSKVVG